MTELAKAIPAARDDISLSTLVAPPGSRTKRVRRGRGIGSGLGKTAGRGGKGQTARSGKGRPKGFEGGQVPLYRRLPKWGFKNPFRKYFEVLNVSILENHFENGDVVDVEKLCEKGLLSSPRALVKILGEGNFTKKVTVKAHRFSKPAIQKITSAGGRAEEVAIPGAVSEETTTSES